MNRRELLAGAAAAAVALAVAPIPDTLVRRIGLKLAKHTWEIPDEFVENFQPYIEHIGLGQYRIQRLDILDVVAKFNGQTREQLVEMIRSWFDTPFMTVDYNPERQVTIFRVEEHPWRLSEL